MKIAILGYDREGRASAEYYAAQGHVVTVCDKNPLTVVPDEFEKVLGPKYLNNLDVYDLVLRTPGLHPRDILAANPQHEVAIWSGTNEFLDVCPTKNVIGVTGTKGKGTTSALIAKMLEAAGKTVHLGGNIGIPALSLLKNNITASDWVVLELSNFQLIDLRKSPKFAVCLMVSGEHLDWHEDLEEYIATKQQLFMNQTSDDIAVYYADDENSVSIADVSEGNLIPYFDEPGARVIDSTISIEGHEICEVQELGLIGEHNWQNVCAAATIVWQITNDASAIRKAATSFTGLPHRIELVRELQGVRYYNDSFASGISATIAAISSVSGPKILIVGGYDRGLEISALAKVIKRHKAEIKKIILIGQTAERVARSLNENKISNYERAPEMKMEAIVAYAGSFAEPGDAVVLSPGFASFDMFKDFEDRGMQFKAAVNAL